MITHLQRCLYSVLFICVMVLIFQMHKISNSFRTAYTAETKYLLYWTRFSNTKDFYLGFGYKPFKTCLYRNCYATSNRTLIPLKKFDALLFHCNGYDNEQPWIRSPHQRYIFVNMESPVYTNKNLKLWNSYFNWTMTYRTDSDISRKYGYIWKRVNVYQMPSEDFFNNKTKLAAWFVSRCFTSCARERLVMQIQRLMDVDIYGRCGKLKCTKNYNIAGGSPPTCYDMLERQYKFYFSFENSYCKEYTTEKLYNVLKKNVVPVVYGYGDYNLTAPPNSVINVADFDSVEQLVSYLKEVAADYKKYIKYFEWKKNYEVVTTFTMGACQICQKLNEPLTTSIYHDLATWWGNDKSMCKVKKALPKIVRDLL